LIILLSVGKANNKTETEMKVKSYSPLFAEEQPARAAYLGKTSYNLPVLIVDGVGPMGQMDLLLADYRLVKATKRERLALAQAGYQLLYMPLDGDADADGTDDRSRLKVK
jgi:hypothetical protein